MAPVMHWSKSDQTDQTKHSDMVNIAPGLLTQHQDTKVKMMKFGQLYHSGKWNKNGSNSSTRSNSINRNTIHNTFGSYQQRKKPKNRDFRQTKHHSFAVGEAKREHMMKLRDMNNSGGTGMPAGIKQRQFNNYKLIIIIMMNLIL